MNSSPTPPQTSSPSTLILKIRGLDNCPSFKNGKVKTQRGLITAPKKKEWMEDAISQLVYQLRGMFPTEEGVMRGECPKPSQTVLYRLLDDSLAYMIPGPQDVVYVEKGSEGVDIIIEFPPTQPTYEH